MKYLSLRQPTVILVSIVCIVLFFLAYEHEHEDKYEDKYEFI